MKAENEQSWKKAYPGLIALVLLLAIFLNPKESFQAALFGLNIFLQSVFPALLPFFITSEIMIGLGMVDFISVLLTPIMRPVFRCPGNSSFVWIMSMTSGYPSGARITAQLYNQKKINTYEAQRILSFCSTSGPLFMISAVGIGMMGSVEGGRVILTAHYTAAVLIGLLFRFYRSREYVMKHKGVQSSKVKNRTHQMIPGAMKRQDKAFTQALATLIASRKKDGRPFGQLMGDSVRNSVNTLLVVGGFIMLFSVLIALLMQWIDHPLIKVLVGGLFEVTTGCKLISDSMLSMQAKIAIASFFIGWSGLSILAQSTSLLSGTGVKISVFMLGKLLHGLVSAALSVPISRFLYPEALEASVPQPSVMLPGWKVALQGSLYFMLLAILLLLLLIIVTCITQWIKKKAAG